MSRAAAVAGLAALCGCIAPGAPSPWCDLLDPAALPHWQVTRFGGDGDVQLQAGQVELGMGSPLTGITWQGPLPEGDYELELTATRLQGNDFFCGLTFPVGGGHLTLVVGGWGGTLVGLSSLDGEDAAHNETARRMRFHAGQPYRIHLRVTASHVAVRIDGSPVLDVALAGRRLGLRPEVTLSAPLGICTFATAARCTNFRWRGLQAAP